MVVLIGLCGFARAGKDETARALVEELGFTRLAFADALKAVAVDCNPTLARQVDAWGWEQAKANPEHRQFLQDLGVACRDHVAQDVWVEAAMRHVDADAAYGTNWVVSDVRFPNEIEAIRYRGGEIWRIDRPGVGPVNGHVSEHAWTDTRFDRVLQNNGTIQDLRRLVVVLARALRPAVGQQSR